MSRNLYGIIENSDLTMRSRIDLKKEIKSNKITDENALLIRIDQKKEEEFKQSEEKLNDDNNISSTSLISNTSELKLKIEDEDYMPTKKELYSYVINSKTNQRFKDRMKKEINNSSDWKLISKKIIETVQKEEIEHEMLLIVNKTTCPFSYKQKINNLIKNGVIGNKDKLNLILILEKSNLNIGDKEKFEKLILNEKIISENILNLSIILLKSDLNISNKEHIEDEILSGKITTRSHLRKNIREKQTEEREKAQKEREKAQKEREKAQKERKERIKRINEFKEIVKNSNLDSTSKNALFTKIEHDVIITKDTLNEAIRAEKIKAQQRAERDKDTFSKGYSGGDYTEDYTYWRELLGN